MAYKVAKKKEEQDEVENERSASDKRKDKIASQCVAQFEAGLKYKEKIMDTWLEIDKTYNLEKERQLQIGRFDYPLPVLSGYVDTLHSKIDDEPFLEYEHLTLADKPRAKKLTSAWRFYSGSEHADWANEDRAGKKMAINTGRAIFLTYCESDPEFAHYFDLVDSYDYVAEALGGGDIHKHRCGFQDNIFRSSWDIKAAPHYNKAQVGRLIIASNDTNTQKNKIAHRQKINRLVSVGLNPSSYTDYAGDQLYRLTQGFTTYQGKMYWVVMDMETGIWLRVDPVKEVFASGKHPYVSWATHYDKFNFWSKSPAMDILPVARAVRDLFNEGMYNIKKRNSGQRAYNAEVFDEPELLEWRPDGLVPATVMPGQSIQSGIFEFKTEDNTQIIVNMMGFADNFVGQKTGITAGAQGASDKDTKVGVYYGDLQQVADRIGLTNKYYVNMWRQAGDLFAWGIWEHFPTKLMIKVVGETGVNWEELTKEDVDPDFAVVPKSGKAELEANEFKKRQRVQSLTEVMADPRLGLMVNPVIAIQKKLRAGEWDEEDIRAIMDVSTIGDEDSLVNASQAIQDLLEGKQPKIYYKASNAFLKKIRDFLDTQELEMAMEKKIMEYFEIMTPIVAENMARRAALGGPQVMAPQGMASMQPKTSPVPGGAGGTASMSQEVSNTMQGN